MKVVTKGPFEVWRQKKGLGPEFVIALHSRRDVESFLAYRAKRERSYGMLIRGAAGGFSVCGRKGAREKGSYIQYWVEYPTVDVEAVDSRVIGGPLGDRLACIAAAAARDVRSRRMAG